MSLLRAMQRTGVRTLVHLSSLAVYGKSSLNLEEYEPFDYTYPNPYVRSQQMIETIIQDTFKTDNEWKIAILRLSNVVGAFEHGILGENIPPLPKNIAFSTAGRCHATRCSRTTTSGADQGSYSRT